MKKQFLTGGWTLEITGNAPLAGERLSAGVPGSVYSALLKAGKIDDPHWRQNELEALKIMDNDFVFETTFDTDITGETRLIFEGLDTLCDISLNGQHIGHADNMHRIWEFDVTGIVKPSGNRLTVAITSPTRYIAARYEEHFLDGSPECMRGFPHLRKAHCMFGWDWGPRLPDAGIWKPVYLAGISDGRIDGVYVSQRHENGAVTLDFYIEHSGGAIEVTVTAPDGEVFRSDGSPITITNPQLWWPNGYGSQPLYSVTVRLASGTDEWTRRIGLRTMTVRREKDEWGESFAHEINGVQIFAMGADYIPEDNLLSRITPERTRALLNDCVLANYNCMRIWGGGFYPHDFFYDICDELGLVVWQDCMFACAVYELSPAVEASIRAELRDNVRRLRHHASLGLWCGNNEMEWQYDDMKITPKQRGDYHRIFEYIIPSVVSENDPNTFYWPASPSCGGGFDAPNDPNRGDTHFWEVWHGMKPFSEYRKHKFRYASEFGFQSFPSLKTIKSFTLESDRNIFSRVMEMHQRHGGANGMIMRYLAATYLYPNDFETLLYASQLLQAEAIRFGVEHWRRNRGRCMGAVYWQLNDIWPVASWASIDYFGRWKALHYVAKRFFSPIMLSCEETGEMTERPFCTKQPAPMKKAARLSVANETMQEVSGVVEWSLRTPSSQIVKSGKQAVTISALSALWLDEMDFSDCNELSNYFSYAFIVNGEVVSRGASLFCMPKHFEFADPQLTVIRSGDEITVTAAAFAKSVEIYSDDDDFILSDNYFDMDAGSVTVKLIRGDAKELKVRSVYNIR